MKTQADKLERAVNRATSVTKGRIITLGEVNFASCRTRPARYTQSRATQFSGMGFCRWFALRDFDN